MRPVPGGCARQAPCRFALERVNGVGGLQRARSAAPRHCPRRACRPQARPQPPAPPHPGWGCTVRKGSHMRAAARRLCHTRCLRPGPQAPGGTRPRGRPAPAAARRRQRRLRHPAPRSCWACWRAGWGAGGLRWLVAAGRERARCLGLRWRRRSSRLRTCCCLSAWIAAGACFARARCRGACSGAVGGSRGCLEAARSAAARSRAAAEDEDDGPRAAPAMGTPAAAWPPVKRPSSTGRRTPRPRIWSP